MVRKISSALVKSSGRGTMGASTWRSAPSCSSWKEVSIVRIGVPSWEAAVRRWEKDRPSCRRSTAKVIGVSGCPPRMKKA